MVSKTCAQTRLRSPYIWLWLLPGWPDCPYCIRAGAAEEPQNRAHFLVAEYKPRLEPSDLLFRWHTGYWNGGQTNQDFWKQSLSHSLLQWLDVWMLLSQTQNWQMCILVKTVDYAGWQVVRQGGRVFLVSSGCHCCIRWSHQSWFVMASWIDVFWLSSLDLAAKMVSKQLQGLPK